MQELGNMLKVTRENQGYTIQDVEEATKIRSYYIDSIEKGNLESLPEKIYAIGFISSYLKFLGVQDETIIEKYKEHFGQVKSPEDIHKESIENSIRVAKSKSSSSSVAAPRPIRTREKSFGSKFIWMVLILIIVASVVILYMIGKNNPTQNPDAVTPPPIVPSDIVTPSEDEPGINNENDPEQNPDANQPAETGLEIKVSAINGNCWVRVEIDGVAQEETIQRGEERVYTGNSSVKIKFGNTKAVQVEHNGILDDTIAAKGIVATVEYTK